MEECRVCRALTGYFDTEEETDIAKFVNEVDPAIPYTLLASYASCVLDDLPTTGRKQPQNV